ncbi:PepSY domain-containing protein [Fulvivirga sp. 29W222]|uniref:PepSY domain-containing protein n=1 Tax=Fulvivirga marina TaxID=2494733 RepID=A0A937KCN7_9BACT|nr:PepSY-associated TM helix domain-containing protein [Fulvivirga marina]MBL6447722.1 PepSY domain-containing protein [Fulvivirga marina]
MSNRIYNTLFHIHTVSGLVISVALFVIFFAGSISFFRDDIINWERQQPIVKGSQMDVDFDTVMDTLAARHSLYGRALTIRQMHQERRVMVSATPSLDTAAIDEAKSRFFLYQDPDSQKSYSYFEDFTLGEFIYRLHFFAQIPYPYGYLLSGFVAFFFLFAIVTGIIVHWKKIISNFYLFRPWAKLKTVWTDAHTALGVIGLPFQFMFAVTGAVLIIGSTVMLGATTLFFYNGDTEKLRKEIFAEEDAYPFANDPQEHNFSINELVSKTLQKWQNVSVTRVVLQNYGDASMHVVVKVKPNDSQRFTGIGQVAYNASTGEEVAAKDPFGSTDYAVAVQDIILKLHFGNYGGYGLKIIYFIFGMITCFVILSGVLLWVEARDKKSTVRWKRKSNQWVAAIVLAVSLSMYPVTALSFTVVKLFKDVNDPAPHLLIFKTFFISWLVFSIFFSIKKDSYFTNKYCLLSGSVLGFLVPIANGVVSETWLWKTFNQQQVQIFVVDAFWLVTSVITFLIVLNLKPKIKGEHIEIPAPIKDKTAAKKVIKTRKLQPV